MMRNRLALILIAAVFLVQNLVAPMSAFAAWDTRLKFAEEAIKKASEMTGAGKLLGTAAKPEVPASVSSKTAIAKAVDEVALGPTATLPKGHPLAGGLGAPIVNKAGEVVSNVLIAPGKKINPITWMRQNSKNAALKGAKFLAVDLPVEAFAFFLALGAINMTQTYFDFAENPVSLQQHLNSHNLKTAEGQIGYASLAAFMAANHSTNALMYHMTGPKSRMVSFVPYLGMTFGFMASNLVHEVANFGELKKCVASLRERIEQEEKYAHCERAYDSFSDAGLEKMQQYAPMLMAMVTSTLTAGIVESLTIKKVIMATSWRFIFEVGTSLSPMGFGRNVIRWTYRLASLYWFTKFQQLQEPGLTQWWKNWIDGGELDQHMFLMITEIDRKKRNGWQPLSPTEIGNDYDLDLAIHKFSQLSKEWRKGNMLDVLNSHGAWLQLLTNFSNTYSAALAFDTFFVGEYEKRFIRKVPSLLDEPYYLSGVKPAVPAEEVVSLDLLNNKKDYEDRQLEHLIAVRNYYEKWLNEVKPEDLKSYPQQYQDIREVISFLPTQAQFDGIDGARVDLAQVAKGLDLLNTKLKMKAYYPGIYRPMPLDPEAKNENKVLKQLRAEIGDPWPLYQPGTGMMLAYDQDSEQSKISSLVSFNKAWNGLNLPRSSHYFLSKMLNGPRADLKQAVVKVKDGFPAEFIPPRLVDSYQYEIKRDQVAGPFGTQPTIFNTPVVVKGAKSNQFSNLFTVFHGKNILPSVLAEKDGFMGWWSKNVESQYINAWNKYENEYQKVLVKLYERYHFTPKEEFSFSKWWSQLRHGGLNRGPMENGLRMSFLQERRLYLMILGEVLRGQVNHLGADHPIFLPGAKDVSVNANQFPLLNPNIREVLRHGYAQHQDPCRENGTTKTNTELQQATTQCRQNQLKEAKTNQVAQVPVLAILGKQKSYNLSGMIAAYKNQGLTAYESENSETHFQFQDRIASAFEELEGLIDQMKLVDTAGGKADFSATDEKVEYDRGKKFISTTITNKQLTLAQEKIERLLEEIDAPLIDDLAPANKHAFQIVQACMIGLRNLAQQQADLGKMVNLVSYVRSDDKESSSTGTSSICSQSSLFTKQKSLTGQVYIRKGCEALPEADTEIKENEFE